MKELTPKQEDQILEEGRERDYENKEVKYCNCGNRLISEWEREEKICRGCR